MNVGEFLKAHQQRLFTCTPDETITTIAIRLSSYNIGALPVCDGDGRLIGVISERDLVRCFAQDSVRASTRHVRDLMTSAVVSCDPNMKMTAAERTMNENRVRHLPVVENGKAVAMLSIRDIMVWRLQLARDETSFLRDAVIAARHA